MEKLFLALKKIYTRIPVSKDTKIRLKNIFYRIFGRFLKNNSSYRGWLAHQQWLEVAAKRPKQGMLEIDWKEVENFEFSGKIAIQLHLFYVDLMDEFVKYFSNMPYQFDLLISMVDVTAKEEVMQKASSIPNVNKVIIKKVENRGRDVAPLVAVFGEELLKYDYFCHVHSKKSLFTGNEQMDWRNHLLSHLFGSERLIRAVFYGFEHGDKVGMVYPETVSTMPYWAHRWLQNETSRDELYCKIGVACSRENQYIDFPMGTMFWGKVQALRQFFDSGLKVEDFPEEKGQTDGTIAHAFERCTVPVCHRNGYNTLIYDARQESFAYNIGGKNFEQYFVKSFEKLKEEAAGYEIISFDLFDTLITRAVARPDDAFDLLEYRLNRQGFPKLAYKELRKEAESLCRQNNPQKDCDLDDIYREFARLSGLPEEACERIKGAEVNHELSLIYPKEEMLECYHYITDTLQKRVFLITDMYLRRKDVERILEKCGITNYEKLFLSCEMNLRKDDGTFWKEFSRKFDGEKWLHIGDNEKSDIQISGDYGVRSCHIMSSADLYGCSNMGEAYFLSCIRDVSTSVSVGLTLKRLFNNPFAINEDLFSVRIKSEEDFGYAVIGPVILGYMNYLCRNIIKKKTEQVFFFAREGYLLKELFSMIKERVVQLSGVKEQYLYVSRRALSVASLQCREDIDELLGIYYRGSFRALLHTRFGIEDPDASDEEIELPEESEKVSGRLEAYQDEILQRAKKERANYVNYYQSVTGTGSGRIAVSDIGYSGTIQYYLSKLTGKTFDGYYFATDAKKKPLAIEGNTMNACYIEGDESQAYSKSYVHRYHLLLESILIAPTGQFVCVGDDGAMVYTEKDNPYYTEKIAKCHEGIRQYIRDFYDTCSQEALKSDIDIAYPEGLMKIAIESGVLDKSLEGSFVVEDYYCSDVEISALEHYRKINKEVEQAE